MARTHTINTLETEVTTIDGYVALDGSSNVLGFIPVTAGSVKGPYTLFKGVGNSISGVNGATAVQPHTSTGVYTFVLDRPFSALLNAVVTCMDATGTQIYGKVAGANVFNTQSAVNPANGVNPGTDASVAPFTIQINFRTSTGTLTDPAVNTGFWVHFLLKNSAVA